MPAQVYWPPELLQLWERIFPCLRCRRDPALKSSKIEWTRYVPLKTIGILPPGQRSVAYVVVAAEPSGDWVKTRRRTLERQRLPHGLRNFNGSCEDLVLQYSLERWLLDDKKSEGYYITDLAKCTLSVARAPATAKRRYANCAPYLQAEVELLRPRAIIAVGRRAFAGVLKQRRKGWPAIFEISHYGKAGQGHWSRYLGRDWEEKVPSLPALERFMRRRRALSLNSEDFKAPHPMHRRLLATYRTQIKAIRKLMDDDPFAISGSKGMRASIRGGDEPLSARAAWLVRAVREPHRQ